MNKALQIGLVGFLFLFSYTEIIAQTVPTSPPPGIEVPASSTLLGLLEKNKIQITIYPNPTKGMININLSNGEDKIKKILVYNIVGNLVLSTFDKNSINLVELPSGLYILKVITESVTFSRKISKM